MDKAAKIVIVLLVVAASGFFIFSKIAGWHKNKLNTAIKQQHAISQSETEKLEQKITELEQELTVVKGQHVPQEKLAEVFGGKDESAGRDAERQKLAEVMGEVKTLAATVRDEKELAEVLRDEKKIAATLGHETKLIEVLREQDKLAKVLQDEDKLTIILQDENKLVEILAQEEKKDDDTDSIARKQISTATVPVDLPDIENRIMAFFSYVDEQPYFQSYNFGAGSYIQYQIAVQNLSSKLPIIAGEMQSLYTMVRNVAHFYRVLGKKRVYVTREILQNEYEIIESVMKTFFQWFTMDGGGASYPGGSAFARDNVRICRLYIEHIGWQELSVKKESEGKGLNLVLLCPNPGQSQ